MAFAWWMKVTVFGLLMLGLYSSSYVRLIELLTREDFNYGYLIPFIMLYLLWEKRSTLDTVPSQQTWFGIFPLFVGIAFFGVGELSGEFYTIYLSSWFVLVALCWMHLGWKKLKIIWFPIAFLIALFPPPNAINFPLTLKFKLLSSKIGVAIIQAYGLSAYREGNIIDLGFTQLQVVDACSGLRFLYPLIIMAILLAYFYRTRFWKRAILVVSAVPITIITNSLRIAMTGILYRHFGAAAAEGFFHGFSGWFIFMFALAILLLEMWVLNGFRGLFGTKLDADKRRGTQIRETELDAQSSKFKEVEKTGDPRELTNKTPNPKKQTQWLKELFKPPQFIVAVLLLAATLVLSQGVEFREKIPMSRSFTEFPLQVGEWSGRRDVLEQKFIDELDFKDYIIVNYVNGTGKMVNFYTAYYDSQRKGESIHSPETCLPGGGWELKRAGLTTVQLNPSKMTINRAFIVQGANKQLTYFWFPLRDRIANSLWEVKLYNFWDALTRQRTDGSLVRLVTPIYKGEDVSDADKRLVDFTKEIVPVLKEFLPK